MFQYMKCVCVLRIGQHLSTAPMIITRHIIVLLTLAYPLLVLNAAADWPPIVDSKRDVEQLPASTTRIRARALPDADIPSLSRLPLLKHLDFGAGQKAVTAAITDKGLAHLAALRFQSLDTLMLGYCPNITDAGLSHLAQMHSVKWLGLEVCPRITDAGVPSLLTMTNLTALDLRGCTGITDKSLEYLATKTNWQTIMLGGCPKISGEAVNKLQRALPNAQVKKDEKEWSFHK
jgi:Leucine Rich repeat